MTLFWAIAAALTAAALAFLLPPLLRRRTIAPDARVAANAEIYREQIEELGAELQRGALTREEFERASREVERRIVAEHAGGGTGGPAGQPAHPRVPVGMALAVGLLVPLAAALGYWQLGEPKAFEAEAMRNAAPQEMADLAERLAARLEKAPDDAEGWSLLGRALASLGQHGRSARAFARAVQLAPEDKELLVEFIKSLALAGRAEYEARNYGVAIDYWERILPFAPPESEFARSVQEGIADARAQGGVGGAPQKEARTEPKAGRKSAAAPSPAAAAISGSVRLDPAVAAKAAPGDTVFILARPASGQRMPLAVQRITVAQLPYQFRLDDSMAMAPGATISSHKEIVVVARVSKGGGAAPSKGDLEGMSGTVAPGASNVSVVLSRVVD